MAHGFLYTLSARSQYEGSPEAKNEALMCAGPYVYLLRTGAPGNMLLTASESSASQSQAERSGNNPICQETEALATLPQNKCKRCHQLADWTAITCVYNRSASLEEIGEAQEHSENDLRCKQKLGHRGERVPHEKLFKDRCSSQQTSLLAKARQQR